MFQIKKKMKNAFDLVVLFVEMASLLKAVRFNKLNCINSLSTQNLIRPIVRQYSFKPARLQGNKKLANILFKSSICLGVSGGSCYLFNSLYPEHSSRESFVQLCKAALGLFIKFAECETVAKNRRTDHYENTIGNKNEGGAKGSQAEATFDWKQFLTLLYKEKMYFLAAVAVIFIQNYQKLFENNYFNIN